MRTHEREKIVMTHALTLGIPLVLPPAVTEKLRRHALHPSDLFDVALTPEAVDLGLDWYEVFAIDRASVELADLGDESYAAGEENDPPNLG
jgi:hypothetical protein